MTDDKMLDKVRKLLAKAERAGTEHEAEAFTAKAQELILRYAIDEAMLQRKGEKQSEQIVARTVYVEGYAKAKLLLLRRWPVVSGAMQRSTPMTGVAGRRAGPRSSAGSRTWLRSTCCSPRCKCRRSTRRTVSSSG
jgi:hypothetical protein